MSVFNQVPVKKEKRSRFDMSHEVKLTGNMGKLIPVLAEPVLPNDTWRIASAQVIRTAPLVTPVMHRVKAYMHYFFVPNRILWENFTDFITGGEDGMNTSVHPFLKWAGDNSATQGLSTLGDYLGLPQNQGGGDVNTIDVNALPFAAYQLIFNEYYRSQDLVQERNYKLVDGDNSGTSDLYALRDRAWSHDYFTSALPFVQKGPEATIPLGSTAPLEYYSMDKGNSSGNGIIYNVDHQNGQPIAGQWPTNPASVRISEGIAQAPAVGGLYESDGNFTDVKLTHLDVSPMHRVNLANATAYTINDLRRSFALQRWLEKNARGGSRYTEYLWNHWQRKSSDARLQRPEFLGGGSTPIQFSEVLQTSQSAFTGDPSPSLQPATPQGNMAGHGLSAGSSGSIKFNAEEHGWIIGILSIMPKTGYMQGIPRKFKMVDKFDYPTPIFANIGEQAILNQEVYADWTNAPEQNEQTFGYVPRYVEAKYINNRVAGQFRGNLKYWHMARDFANRPNLNAAFIASDPTRRIFAVTDPNEDTLYINVYFNISTKRTLPYFGQPI